MLLDEWRDVSFVLRAHHDHEDEFCDPPVRRRAPQLRDELEGGHCLIDHRLAALDGSVDRIRAAGAIDRARLLRGFHLDLATSLRAASRISPSKSAG